MIEIIDKDKRISEIAGHSDLSTCNELRISPYVYSVAYGNGKSVFANIFTRFYFAAPTEYATNLRHGELLNIRWWNSLDSNIRSILIENRVVIPQNTIECDNYLSVYRLYRDLYDQQNGITRYNILTTNACNANCDYCFEKKYNNRTVSMGAETAKKVAKFILDTHAEGHKIYLRWFGGEPLVNHKVIDIISSILLNNRIDYYSTMSTNGLLCSNDIIQKASSLWKMSKIRISMDGWGNEHDSIKRFRGQHDGFNIIMQNMDKIIDSGIILTVRLNINENNIEGINKLADYLCKKYQGVGNFNMYCRCLFDDISESEYSNNIEHVNKIISERDRLEEKLIDNGTYDYEKLSPEGLRLFLCAAQDPRKIVITPSGGLCKCECYASDSVSWGKVGMPIHNKDIFNYWHCNTEECREKCRNCQFLPLCTPYNRCPMSYIECHARFEHTLKLFLIEQYKRHLQKRGGIMLNDALNINIKFNQNINQR